MPYGRFMIRRLKACLNGSRRPDEHPAVPVTPSDLAAAATGAAAAGAEAVHVHPRDRAGRETLHGDAVSAAVRAIRAANPGLPIGVSTGLWICGGDPSLRAAEVARWASLPASGRPDFASVNVSEPGFQELVGLLRAAGIDAEAGVWSPSDALALPGAAVSRVLIEVIDAPAASAVAVADGILAALDEVGSVEPRLLHGENDACWPLVSHAARLGLPTRIGLEDTLVGPSGEPVRDNKHLVELANGQFRACFCGT
jgi:uncharacterized protein (DUF849 family)